ncbi:intracellular septation protein [Sphingomonas japonica]|uniref:Inner membrane-spanning protein YciB n=2 Tax=Sphingomonas japonica TaxID=511662 RepID=A0ABX0U5X4_9SPHN|nr:intracellular septation protein [Sphingomonas japonica]
MALDFGPLAVFFAINTLLPGSAIERILAATAGFMVAIVMSMAVAKWKAGGISPMLWLSGGLVLVFGSLTLYFHDSTFIKMKPTVVYAMFAAILGFGAATGRPLLRTLLETAYPGLSEAGWRKLTINWACFFVFMAVVNEAVWRTTAPNPDSDLTFWAGFKLWGAIPLTMVFALVNIPMLLRHGLQAEAKDVPLPPEG